LVFIAGNDPAWQTSGLSGRTVFPVGSCIHSHGLEENVIKNSELIKELSPSESCALNKEFYNYLIFNNIKEHISHPNPISMRFLVRIYPYWYVCTLSLIRFIRLNAVDNFTFTKR
jgi:hypothetical protein